MFYHVVMMRFSARADAGFHRKVEGFAERVRRECVGLLYYDYGQNIAERGKGFDRVVLSVFESSPAHDAYQVSPVHQEMKAFMLPYIEDLVVCDSDVPVAAPIAKRGR